MFTFTDGRAGLLRVDLLVVLAASAVVVGCFLFFFNRFKGYSDTVIRKESWRWLSLLLFFFFFFFKALTHH